MPRAMGKAGGEEAKSPKRGGLAVVFTEQQKRRLKALRALNLTSTDPTPLLRMMLDDYIRRQAQESGLTIRDLDEVASRLDSGQDAVWPVTGRPKS